MTCKTCSGQGRWDDIPCTACGGTGGDEPVVTPLRTRAIDAAMAYTVVAPSAVHAVVDALLAANLLHDPDLSVTGDGSGTALPLIRDPRDDEARIERAARAIHERHFPRTPWEDSRDDARDYCRDEARVALAAADQEDAT